MFTTIPPSAPWRRDVLVVSVAGLEHPDAVLPSSIGLGVVTDLAVTAAQHWLIREGQSNPLPRTEPTRVTEEAGWPANLADGSAAPRRNGRGRSGGWEHVREVVADVVSRAARDRALVVTHDADRGLRPLLNLIQSGTRTDFPSLEVLDTEVLERARASRLAPHVGEPAVEFYQRILAVPAYPVPQGDAGFAGAGPVRQGDPLFAIFATHDLYRRHFGGTLFRPTFIRAG